MHCTETNLAGDWVFKLNVQMNHAVVLAYCCTQQTIQFEAYSVGCNACRLAQTLQATSTLLVLQLSFLNLAADSLPPSLPSAILYCATMFSCMICSATA